MKTNQSEPFIVAQSSSTAPVSSPQQTATIFTLWTVALTAMVTVVFTLFLVKFLPKNVWFIKAKDRLMKAFGELHSVEPGQEFATDVEVSNIRTLDNLRATVQATIYVCIEDVQKAKKFLYAGDRVSAAAVDKAVKKRAESTIRGLTSKVITLDELHKSRGNIIPQAGRSQRDDERNLSEEFVAVNISEQAKELLQKDLSHLGLEITSLVIGEIDEIPSYTATNYFDAQALQHRTNVIQNAILATRQKELDTEKQIHEWELDAEKQMQEYKLGIGHDIRKKEWEVSSSLEEIEVNRQLEHLGRLKILEGFEKGKIDHELNIELHKNKKERELQKEIETSKLSTRELIETTELEIKEKIESLRSEVHKVIENKEVEVAISIIQAEQKRLGYEIVRAKTAEDLTTEIEQAKSKREKLKAEIAAASVENEAQIIERLAKADSIRHNLIPATDADRTVHLIREILPELPKFVEIAQALAPQAGILGDSNIYTFQNDKGEDISKLMLSTSSLLLIQSLLDGKLGSLLLDLLRSLKSDSKSKEDDRSEVKIP
ncbi:MAG: hypothetical protein KME16_21210 [Scytolyngbya sp. HA4215-MV1]|jgi:uncharacterized membrane protein YqiK|nr:hypothetical protein [Scytolyngbya sp. HA4215-MV1]